jgi:E3 ubiquitin-protein ligase RGLG
MAVAESVGRSLVELLDGDRRIPCLGFGDSASVDSAAQVLHIGEGVGVDGVLDVYRAAVARFSSPAAGVAAPIHFAGPTSFAGPIRFAMAEAERHPDRLSVLIIITDGAINDAPLRWHNGKSVVDLERSPTVQAIQDAAALPLFILIVGVGDGPFDQLLVLDDYLPARRVDNVQAVVFTEYQARMRGAIGALDEFARLALCELPFFLDSLAQKGFTAPHPRRLEVAPVHLDAFLAAKRNPAAPPLAGHS